MIKNPKDLGLAYRLGKRKGAKSFEVCALTGDWLTSMVDGSKVCKEKDMTRWRYFREAQIIEMDVPKSGYSPGERIRMLDEDSHDAWFYIVQVGDTSGEGKIELLVGL